MKQIPQPGMRLRAAVIAGLVALLGTLTFSQGLKGAPHQAPPAPVPQTGQTTSFATGDDGDLQEGVPFELAVYWSSSTVADDPASAWAVNLDILSPFTFMGRPSI